MFALVGCKINYFCLFIGITKLDRAVEEFIAEEGIRISEGRLKIFAREFPLDEIEGVFVAKHTPSLAGPLIFLAMGLLLLTLIWWAGLIVIALAVLWHLSRKSIFGFELVISGERYNVLYHKNGEMLEKLRAEISSRQKGRIGQ